MNSDSLLAVSFIWDTFNHEHALVGFQLPRIPSIFPDLVMQAAAVAISPSYRWSVFAYGWMQLVLFVLTAAWVAALIGAGSYSRAVSISAILIATVIMADSSVPGGTGTTFYYFLSCTHFGPFLASLLASAVAFKLLQDDTPAWAILLFALATLALLSNRLLLAAFAVPVCLAALLVAGWTRKAARVVVTIAASVVAAHLLDSQINRQPNLAMDWRQSATRLQLFLTETVALVYDHLWVVAACVFVPLAIFGAYLLSLARNRRAFLGREVWPEGEMAKAYFCLTAAGAMAAVFSAVALLAYADRGSHRYIAPVLAWPIIFAIAAVASTSLSRKAAYVVGIVVIVLCAGDSLRRGSSITPGTVSWRSPVAVCILANKDRFKLEAGIAEYWLSRPVMFDSGWTLQVNQARNDGVPYIWGNNPYWYTVRFDGRNGRPEYNFVVMERMDPGRVMSRFGEPSARIRCAAGQEIWVYSDGKRMTERFLEPFRGWRGANL
jgi:hypothetical protein